MGKRTGTNLTKAKIEELKPGTTIQRLWDLESRGLGIQITPGGVRSWILSYRFDGQKRMATLGRWPDMPVSVARDQAEAVRTDIRNGIDPTADKKARREKAAAKKHEATIADLADRHIREHIQVNNRPSWAREATRLIQRFILPELGKMLIRDVGPANISALLYQVRKETPTQANRVRAVLRTMFSRAEEWELRPLGSNPVAVVKQRTPEVKRERRLSDLELKALGKTLRESQESPHVLAAVRLALQAGMRKGEIQALRWEWVDLNAEEIRIPREVHKTGSKTGKVRVVHLCFALVTILKALPRTIGCPYVVPGMPKREGKRKEKRVIEWRQFIGLQGPWERIRVAAGLAIAGKRNKTDPGWHDLRRTFGSVGSDLGLRGFVGELIGHAEQTVTDIYSRPAAERLKDAAEAIGSRIEGILSGSIDPDKEAEERRQEKEKRLKAGS